MSEFLKLLPPEWAREILFKSLPEKDIPVLEISTEESLGNIVARDILAPHPLPNFPRSTVDGYAVCSPATYGASNNLPIYLKIIGEGEMGQKNNYILGHDQAVLIHTGGMIPTTADSVVMIEDTQKISGEEIELRKATAPGENILSIGEEINIGDTVVSSGTKIRSIEIGGLKALGINRILVRTKPRVGIISSGDEIVDSEVDLQIGQVRDVNTFLLSSLIDNWGGHPIKYGIVKDDLQKLTGVAKKAIKECELLIITAGSSVSTRDITSRVINLLGDPGVIVHGANIRPGKPTILAVCSGKAVIGLPGNPVSAYVTANLFVKPVIEFLLQVKRKERPTLKAQLALNVPSKAGREDWIPVYLNRVESELIATPLFIKSNFILSLIKADGLICIKANRTGLESGEIVDVFECD
jgi:molybdopterin molybdotransferase